MKKLFIVFSLAAVTFAANAQDQTTAATTPILSKRGYAILPEAGDWGLTYDAAPILGYIGNIFHSNGTSASPSSGFSQAPGTVATQAITGKYFMDANTAIRARVRIGFGSTNSKTDVAQIGGSANSQVVNETKVSNTNITLAAGIEKRKGIGRVQGFYGAEFMIASGGGSNTKYTYGNPLSSSNPGSQTTQNKVGGTLQIGPRAFIGAEYFIAPKVSLGAEFGWSVLFGSTGKSTTTVESYNAGTNTTTSTTSTSTTAGQGGGGGINIDTDNLSGAINLNFYF